MAHAVLHTYHFQIIFRPSYSFPFPDPRVHHRQLHISQGAGAADEVVGLEYKADLLVADTGKLPVLCLSHVDAVQNVVPLRGPVQDANDIHQRRFPGSGGAYDGDKFPFLYRQIDAVQDLQLIGLADIKAFDNSMQINDISARKLRGGRSKSVHAVLTSCRFLKAARHAAA